MGHLVVEYTTAGPKKEEKEIRDTDKSGNIYSNDEIEYKDVLDSTYITELNSIGKKDFLKIYVKEEN